MKDYIMSMRDIIGEEGRDEKTNTEYKIWKADFEGHRFYVLTDDGEIAGSCKLMPPEYICLSSEVLRLIPMRAAQGKLTHEELGKILASISLQLTDPDFAEETAEELDLEEKSAAGVIYRRIVSYVNVKLAEMTRKLLPDLLRNARANACANNGQRRATQQAPAVEDDLGQAETDLEDDSYPFVAIDEDQFWDNSKIRHIAS